jgi:hypothetical protein
VQHDGDGRRCLAAAPSDTVSKAICRLNRDHESPRPAGPAGFGWRQQDSFPRLLHGTHEFGAGTAPRAGLLPHTIYLPEPRLFRG